MIVSARVLITITRILYGFTKVEVVTSLQRYGLPQRWKECLRRVRTSFFLQFGLYSSVRADDLSICSRYIESSLVKMLPCLGVQPSPYLGTSV